MQSTAHQYDVECCCRMPDRDKAFRGVPSRTRRGGITMTGNRQRTGEVDFATSVTVLWVVSRSR